MIKIIKYTVLILFSSIIIYFGVFRDGFRYFTGLGTPYSFIEAYKAAKYDSILVFYEQDLVTPIYLYNTDSLALLYGFKTGFGGGVSYSVMELYNSIIEKELKRRLGKERWNEYLSKCDSAAEQGKKNSPFYKTYSD